MPGSSISIRITVVLVWGLALLLGACGGNPDAVKESEGRNNTRSQSQRAMNQGLGGNNKEEGSLFGPGGVFGSKADRKEDNGSGVAVNAYLWRASLDTINFIPLVSADPFGGVIITDWYSPPETPAERFKVNIFILDRQLRSDAIRAAVFHQRRQGNSDWLDVASDASTQTDLENAILTRARQLRIASAGVK